jgi:hypothetical protein
MGVSTGLAAVIIAMPPQKMLMAKRAQSRDIPLFPRGVQNFRNGSGDAKGTTIQANDNKHVTIAILHTSERRH